MNKIFELITVGAAIQGLFLAVILIRNNGGNKRANLMLAVLTLIFSISIFHSSYISVNFINHNTENQKMNEPFLLLIGPFIYFYVRELMNRKRMIKIIDVVHFIPFIMYFAIWGTKLFGDNAWSEIVTKNENIFNIGWWILTIVLILLYIRKIVKITGIHDKKLEEEYSNLDKMGLEWVKGILMIFVVLLLIVIAGVMIIYIHNKGNHFGRMVSFVAACTIYVMGYRGLRQPDIFTLMKKETKEVDYNGEDKKEGSKVEREIIIENNVKIEKYRNSNLSENEIFEIERKIRKHMEEEKPYLDPEFSMDMLSDSLTLNKQYVSQVINSKFGYNFFNFINSYRVEDVKKRIADPENDVYTILSIAFDSGFNSKASFNNIFKKFTEMTPSEYRKSIR